MMRQVNRVYKASLVLTLVPVAFLAVALFAMQASAKSYPSYECASAKIKAAGQRCREVLGARSIETKTQRDLQSRIDKADAEFDAKWASAEDDAAAENVDCVDMTLSSADMKTLMDDAIDEIVADATAGLDLGVAREANCGARILNRAGVMCRALLRAESRYIEDLSRDPDGEKCDAVKEKMGGFFGRRWDGITRGQCPTAATKEEIRDDVAALSDDVVTNITVSPNVPDDSFMAITHPAGGDPGNEVSYEDDTLDPPVPGLLGRHSFFAKRGSVNKLLMYYEGGGACWDRLTCGLDSAPRTRTSATTPGSPSERRIRLRVRRSVRPRNPFKDWHIVYVPYCSCDIHLG